MSDLMIASGIKKSYREAGGELHVLRGLDLTIRQGETLAVVGPSGVGKSTLLHTLGLLDTATSGSIIYDGTELSSASERHRARLRNVEFGFVFQFYHLLPELNALENVVLPAMMRCTVFGWSHRRAKLRARAENLLADVGLSERWTHKPSELSGGEQQRVAIARALVNEPRIVFCDEPTGNLDEKTSDHIHDLLWTINQKTGTTFVVVTHDETLASRCDRIAEMHRGKIESVKSNRR